MRIIGGKFGGRRFNPPVSKWPTRPTTDYARESLFNILANSVDLESSKVLDLFGGTGGHSFECISRGCRDVTYVDNHAGCVQFVSATADVLGVTSCITVRKTDVFKFLEQDHSSFDYIFADPPFNHPKLAMLPALILNGNCLTADGLFVLEHDASHQFGNLPGFVQSRRYGHVWFTFFSVNNKQVYP
jgi:16S rRNA (guanine966-N2)-methyltransferase